MPKLTEYTSYADAQAHANSAALWELFDGDRDRLNLAHECVDRHATLPERVAVRIAYADGRDEHITYQRLKALSSQMAHFLKARGVGPGDRVAIMLEPTPAFYAGLFGAIKAGAIAVPLFTLFGPDGLRLRIDDCTPKVLLTNAEKAPIAAGIDDLDVIIADDAFLGSLAAYPDEPVLEESEDRGVQSGARTESVTLVAEGGGSGAAPAISLDWYNLKSGEVETASVDGFPIRVDGPPAPSAEPRDWRAVGLAALAALAHGDRVVLPPLNPFGPGNWSAAIVSGRD